MDPLTTTITVVTFLGSIIKLAEEIKNSFEKVPKNKKKLQKLSGDVLRGLLELGRFYDERGHLLDGSTDFQAALDNLSLNIQSVYARCSGTKLVRVHGPIDKAIMGLKAWYRAGELEAEIAALRDEVHECYIRFTAFAVARLDQPIAKIVRSTSRIENTIFLLDQHHRAGLSRIEGAVASPQKTECDTQGTCAITNIDTKAVMISPSAIESLYLHQQVEILAESLSRVGLKTLFYHEPNGLYRYPLAPTVISHDSSPAYHRHTVAVALEILRILDDMPNQLSVQIGAWNMVNLAIRLHSLEMCSDAVKMGIWTVSIYRALASTNPIVYKPFLALALHNLSRFYVDVDDDHNAGIVLDESIRLLFDLLCNQTQDNIRILLSSSLMASWSILTRIKEVEQGLKMAYQSLDVLETIWEDSKRVPQLESPHGQESTSTNELLHRPSMFVEATLKTKLYPQFDKSTNMWLDFNTARTFYGISCSLYDLERYQEALEIGKKSFNILSTLTYQYPGSFDAALAGCLAHLSRPYIGVDYSAEDTIPFSEKAVQTYRRLYCTRPKKFTEPLIKTLWEYAILLSETGKGEAAKIIAEEAIGVIRQSEKGQRLLAEALHHSSSMLQFLGLNEGAIELGKEVVAIYRQIATEVEVKEILADRMCNLSQGLRFANHLDDAIVVCQEAIDIYRSIVGSNGNRSEIAGLAMGLSLLTHITYLAGQLNLAAQAGMESLTLYKRVIHDDDSLFQDFLIALKRTLPAVCECNHLHALTWSAQIISDYKTLETLYTNLGSSIQWCLIGAYRDRDFILGKHRLFHEALLNSEQLAKTVKSITTDSPEQLIILMDCLSIHVGNLMHAGRTEEAISTCEETVRQARKIQITGCDLDLPLANVLYQYSQCLRAIGRDDEALAASEEMVTLQRRYPSDEDGIYSLSEHSINLVKAKHYAQAIEFAKEAVKRCRCPDSTTVLSDFLYPHALEALANCYAETGDEDQALAVIEEAVDFYRKSRFDEHVIGIWAYIEALYADALVAFAHRSMMKENWTAAEAALLEARNIYQSRVVDAPGYYPDLAVTLESTALFLNAVGRNDDSARVTLDLNERQLHLKALYPEVAKLTQVALDDLKTRPSQLAIRQKISMYYI